ncbi:MAG TPA: NAD(P)-dependent oxidoreductase [Candidatus Binatia bacterium]|nr:NAD(P)-dependent oxidoreductase [Candidatus Binatia bacterium]
MKFGFIGVGNMGNPMALNLVKAGHSLLVHDIRREAAANLEEAGATWVNSPREAATGVEATFFSLPMPADVERVVLADNGVLAGMRSGGTIIDMSTNSPSVVRSLAEKTKAKGVTFLDAPVSGGVRGARNATLAIMVGGDKAVYDKYESVLKAIGANVFHCGDTGAGNVVKLVNNMLAFIHMMGAAEAVILGTKAGVDPNILWQAVKASSGGSFVWESGTRAILRDRLAPTFTVDLASKDISLATALAKEIGVPLKMGTAAEELIRHYQAHGYAKEDVIATIKELEKQTGTVVRGTWKESN